MQRVPCTSICLIVACGFAIVGTAGNADEESDRRDAAIAAFVKLGGRITFYEQKEVASVLLEGPNVTDASLKHLQQLRMFDIIPVVRLFETSVTDAGLAHLKGLKKLTRLSFTGTLGDAGLAHLSGMTQLRSLNLPNSNNVTDAGVKHLKGLTNLESLTLARCKVTDAGLEHLKGMTNLEALNLSETTVSDAGLEHLKGLTNLQRLEVGRTRVTEAGFKKLQQALPDLGRRAMITPRQR